MNINEEMLGKGRLQGNCIIYARMLGMRSLAYIEGVGLLISIIPAIMNINEEMLGKRIIYAGMLGMRSLT